MLAALLSARRPALAITAALCLSAAAGCQPLVSLHHTEVRGATTEGLAVTAVMVVENENAFDIDVRRVHANVTVAGRYRLPAVDVQPNKRIPASRKARIAVPVVVPWTMVPGLLAESASSSEVPYRMQGRADVTAARALSVSGYPVDQEGTIPRSAFQSGVPSPAGVPGGFPF